MSKTGRRGPESREGGKGKVQERAGCCMEQSVNFSPLRSADTHLCTVCRWLGTVST